MYSLLLLPLGTVQPLLSHLLALLEQLNDFNRLLPETVVLEEEELGLKLQKTGSGQLSDPRIIDLAFAFLQFQHNIKLSIYLIDKSEESVGPQQLEEECRWVWLLDLERSVALAVGRCLGGMLQGPPPSLQEKTSELWLSNVLLRNGLEMDFEQLGRETFGWLSRLPCVQMFRK